MQQVQVLVVEDESIVGADIRQNLTMLGYRVPAVLASGEEAIKKAAEECPDLVLMDIHLKGKIDGIEAAKIVQSRLKVPVVFITAFADEATIQRAKSTEPYGYIVKPFGKKELQSTIEIALYKYGRERRLKTNEQWLMSIIRNAGEALLVVDEEGSICLMNALAEVITGRALEESLGAHWADLWRFPSAKGCGGTTDPISHAIQQARRIDLLDCPVRFINTGNRTVVGSVSPIRDGPNRVSGAVITFRDVTADRTVETQFRHVRHLQGLQRLAGAVAHNLNGVLTIISGYTEALIHSLDPADPRHRDVQMIESAGERAGVLTRQLIAFSRQQPLQPALLDINEHMASLEPVLTPSPGPLVDFQMKLEPGLGQVEADPSHLDQIVVALVQNAREAMPGGGALTVSTAREHLDSAAVSKFADIPAGDYVVLRVADTGAGIPYEHQAQVFEPFFTTKERQQGAGLALAAVYGLVKQNGGHIVFESEPGHGTVFSVYFPLRAAPHVNGHGSFPYVRGGTETILVVDDHAFTRQFATDALRGLGYRVLEARNGVEAIGICERTSENIDLVVSDVMLPNMTALELAGRLSGVRSGLKVLFTCAFSPYALKHHGAVQEDTPLLQKPFTAAALAASVREALDET